jgi:hypothetical protein
MRLVTISILLLAFLSAIAVGISVIVSYQTSGAESWGPYQVGGSIVFDARSVNGSEVVASYRTEEFFSGDVHAVKFCMHVEGNGYVDVFMWVRTSDTGSFPHYATPDVRPWLPDLFKIPAANGTVCALVDVDLIERLIAKKQFHWFLEFYHHTNSEVKSLLLSFEANPPETRSYVELPIEIFVSGNVTGAGNIVRIALYLKNTLNVPVTSFKVVSSTASVVYEECSFCHSIEPGLYGKYVVYVRPARGAELITVSYSVNGTVVYRQIQLNFSRVSTTPRLLLEKSVVYVAGDVAKVVVSARNVGNASAYYVRLSDPVPECLVWLNGTVKAQFTEIRPGEQKEISYLVSSRCGYVGILPPAVAIYYDRELNEFWEFSNLPELRLLPSTKTPTKLSLFPPRPPINQTIYVIDVRAVPQGVKVAAMSLQGVVNKYKPSIFLIYRDEDWLWVEELRHLGVEYRILSLEEALKLFRPYLKGYITYNTSLPDTYNLALALAYLNDALIVPEGAEGLAGNLPKLYDLSHWRSREELYRFYISRVLPRLNDKVVVNCDRPGDLWLADYAVSTGSIVVTLSPRRDGSPYTPYDWVLMEEVLDRYKPPAFVMGWWLPAEESNLIEASHKGLIVLSSDVAPNFSILSSVSVEPVKFRHIAREAGPDPDGVYITFVRSDGDSPYVSYYFMFASDGPWYIRNRPAPMGWTIQPLLAELAPVILKFYAEHATEYDDFIAGPSGAGYFYPSFIPRNYRGLIYSIGQYYLDLVNLTAVNILDSLSAQEPAHWLYPLLAVKIQYMGARYFLHGYSISMPPVYYEINGTIHLFVNIFTGDRDAKELVAEIDRIVSTGKRPLFIVVYVWSWGSSNYQRWIELTRAVSQKYRVVTPTELFRLAEQYLMQGAAPQQQTRQAAAPSDDVAKSLKEEFGRLPVFCLVYFSWYANAMGPTGVWHHWSLITYKKLGGSAFYPMLGPYDSGDPSVVEAHLRLIKESGVDCLFVDWWGIYVQNLYDEHITTNIDLIAREATRLGLKPIILYESDRPGLSVEKVASELEYAVRRWGEVSVKIGDAPVVYIWAPGARGRDAYFWCLVREMLKSRGVNVFMVGATDDERFATCFDALLPWFYFDVGSYDALRPLIQRGIVIGATAIPGYDDRPAGRNMVVPREEGATFRKYLDKVLSLQVPIVLIYSWNEFHEGSSIEPTLEYTNTYVKILQEYTGVHRYFNVSVSLKAMYTPGLLTLQLHNDGNDSALYLVLEIKVPGAPVVLKYSLIGSEDGVRLHLPVLRPNATYILPLPLYKLGPAAVRQPLEPDALRVNGQLMYLTPGGELKTSSVNTTFYRLELITLATEVKYVAAGEKIVWQPLECIPYSGIVRMCLWTGNATGTYVITSPAKLVAYYKFQWRAVVDGRAFWLFLDEDAIAPPKLITPR